MFEYYDILTHPEWKERFYDYIDSSSNVLRSKNYKENLDLHECKAMFVWVYDNSILGFSGIRQRPHWPDKTVRIYDRFFADESIRYKGLNYEFSLGNFRFQIIGGAYKSMMKWCDNNDIKLRFVSREDSGNINSISSICIGLNNQAKSDNGSDIWSVYPEYVNLCYPSNKKSCIQKVAYVGDESLFLKF